ncbi:MAG: PAS domain-containing protein [Chitinophagaceae bacterium]|nr:PAS domain-containing protein [Chitinophagaceae bacterium]
MLESFLSDFNLIRDTLDKQGDPVFFDREFSFFAADPVLFYDTLKDRIVYMNKRFAEEFRFSVENLAAFNYSIYPLLSAQDQEIFRSSMQRLSEPAGASLPDSTYQLISQDKRSGYYLVKLRKLYGNYYYLQLQSALQAMIPVLDNKTAEQLVGEAEGILKFGFWVWDVISNRVFWTRGMYQLLGLDPDSGEPPVTAFDSRFTVKDQAWTDFEKRFRDGQVKNSYRQKYHLKNASGTLMTVCDHGRIEYDAGGKMIRILGLTQEITQQEQSMKGLADYRAMMLENETFLKYGSWESDPAGDNIKWTDGMYGIFGYDNDDKKKLVVNSGLYDTHMRAANEQNGATSVPEFLAGKSEYHREMEIQDKQGAVKILSTYAKIIRDAENNISKIIGTTRDVTEIKENERMLENKIAELNRSNKELEEFAYIASHDLQEPLRKISTFIQRLQLKVAAIADEDTQLYIKRIQASADNMRNLIDNLLEFSRISRNKQPAEHTDLSKILADVIGELDMSIEETGATIEADELPVIDAIPSQMMQLFHNLLNNAIKFRRPDTPPVITIRQHALKRDEKKTYNLDTGKDYVMITVADNGIGFEDIYADKIFQLFQRLHAKYEYPGTGIGLSICKKIVSNHGGEMFAKGEPGAGSSFYIILPKVS